MAAVNTDHTLNDYRLSVEPSYENGSSSKLSAGALVVAIFLGAGAYYYYSTPQRSADTAPSAGDMNYQSPADIAASTETMDGASMPGLSDTTATSPAAPLSTDATATPAPAQEPVVNRMATENKPLVSPAQPAPSAKQSTQPLIDSTSEAPSPATDDTESGVPMTQSAPMDAPQPTTVDEVTDTTQDPVVTQSVVPADTDPNAVESSGG